MARLRTSVLAFRILLLALCFARATALRATDTNIESQLRMLQQQNEALQNQLHQQQELIDSLRRDVAEIHKADDQRNAETAEAKTAAGESMESRKQGGFNFGKIHLSGEGAAGIFETGSEGAFPNAEFRVDEARLFVDAQVCDDVYAYAELNFATREEPDVQARLGEFYLDVEDISKLWDASGQLNARLGRMYTPFGEEYLTRYAINNPLISHSLSDIWGVDEGLEIYGVVGKFGYVTAVQNGGVSDTHDFDGDKSVAGRLSYDPNHYLHFSVSGMRTGNLNSSQDHLSALWFGNGFFRPLGGTLFHANLFEGDIIWRLPHTYVHAFGGYIQYDDNDPTADNERDVYYYSVEGIQDLPHKFYTGARFSQIFAHNGFPIVGNSTMHDYLFGPLTDRIWRLSLGLGYRWNKNLILKGEYTIERGNAAGSEDRDHEDMVAAQAAFAF
jgi:hypothetical protein